MDLAMGVAHVLALQGKYDQSRVFLDSLPNFVSTAYVFISGCPLPIEFALLDMHTGNLERARKAMASCSAGARPKASTPFGVRYALDLLTQCNLDLNAMDAAEAALGRAEAIWGKDPPAKAFSRILRARLYRTDARFRRLKGDLVGAETAVRTALEMHEKDLAAPNYDVVLDQIELAEVLRARGVLAQAEAMYQASFKALITALGPGQPLAKRVLRNYADLLRLQNREKDLAQVEGTLAKLPVIPCTSCSPPIPAKPGT